MIVPVPSILNPQQIAHCREVMNRANWVDGRVTAGHQSDGQGQSSVARK